ncbi:hypothetical protein [Helicobacter typhlonius]|uniref:hypothetical protein n=1 Tax=Helicobacter typhlonius TaxID=76936 RepID=UPI002FE312E5
MNNKKISFLHLRYFILFMPFLLFSVLQASVPLWAWERELELEKEQTYQATFQVGDVQKELLFRWTLYKNYGLVIHIRYDKFNHQVVLYTDYQRNSYKILLGNSTEKRAAPHLVMFFKEFINKEEKAYLKLYIEGQGVSVLDERISPSKKKAQDSESTEQDAG